MVIVRPVRLDDFDKVLALAQQAHFGLTNLPKEPEFLRKRVSASVQSFATAIEKPRGELYMLVMEDLATGVIIGTSSIISKIGGFEPFYAYRIETCVHESEMLKVRKMVQTLHLVAEHSGPSEIGGLFLAPDHRKHGNGRLLSLSRFLFMANHPTRFEPMVIAEMRGVLDDKGQSPFWEAIGRHFFDIDYPDADRLCLVDKRFIAELMPTCPIYVPLLPKTARDVIGQVHEKTKPALKMLRDEGFESSEMVDIFEAGPIIHCKLEQVRIVKESRTATVTEIAAEPFQSVPFLVITAGLDFRACVGAAEHSLEGVRLTAETALALDLKLYDSVRISPLHPPKRTKEG